MKQQEKFDSGLKLFSEASIVPSLSRTPLSLTSITLATADNGARFLTENLID